MTKIFYPSAESLTFLLECIQNREVALPDFQRDFVWEPRATEELIESLCQNFPAGSLLRIKNSQYFYFQPREFYGAPKLDGHEPSYLILDGQQRLTSLYQALHGIGTHRYFANLHDLMDCGGSDGKELEDCIFCMRKADAEKRYSNIAQQAEWLVMPLSVLYEGGFEEWLDGILGQRSETQEELQELKKRLRKVRQNWLKPLEDYEFPMITLAEDTSGAAVCTIFETLNRTGVKLSAFDLLAARFWPKGLHLRDKWLQALKTHPIVQDFQVDPYYVLQAVAIFNPLPDRAPSCKRKDILELKVEQVRDGWDPVIEGLASALELLRDNCGVLVPGVLPYNTALIPIAAAVAKSMPDRGPAIAASRDKLRRWFWCSTFGQAYENAPNSQAVVDYVELTSWINGGEPPKTVANFVFNGEQLRETTGRQRAVYRGVMALILAHGARDFHTGIGLTPKAMVDTRVDDHHVFPQGFLAERDGGVDPIARDCVLNRTLIDQATDVRIGKSPPSAYLAEIEAEVEPETLKAILASHLLPSDAQSSLRSDRFEDFLDERAKLISEELSRVTT
jgi:hypothetical protein